MIRLTVRGCFVAESWTGIVVGLCGMSAAVLLVAVHYWREMTRRRKLKRMDHRDWWEVMRDRH
ncbi:hypothetical protein BCY88_12185 [Paraburkholderia fungorum]|uniref:Uncharacterized protein n=1 Tax=Paraburkholderia fungorum TaxID=134537 RepID=A0A3R7HJY0_9BURK|nr:hypothetical protein BCY88_12185 [Paraburkholderia fungorum]